MWPLWAQEKYEQERAWLVRERDKEESALRREVCSLLGMIDLSARTVDLRKFIQQHR